MHTVIDTELNWTNFDWQYFQTLSIQIAKGFVPDCTFTEHLRPGQKQDGIDILGFKRKEGKFITIQCKRKEKLTEGDIKNIISEFRTGSYFENCSHFILATSANLQTQKLQNLIHSYEIEFNNTNIEFHCWDRKHIETFLKDNWKLVSYYFGEEQADRFCYPQVKYENIETFRGIPDFIPRKINKLETTNSIIDGLWNYTQREYFDIKEIIINNRDKGNHICLIGDAYQGKSYYLKQTAFDLQNGDQSFQVLFIEVKNYNVQSFEILIGKIYGAWKNIPFKDLVIIIDGIDETPSEKFGEIVKHINEFSQSYNPINIIFSCRRLFFTKYEVQAKLKGFDIFELSQLDQNNIDWYLSRKVSDRINEFKASAYISGIGSLLFHPFYLIHITEQFLQPPYKLPESKIKVIDGLIDRSFKTSFTRQTKGSDSVKDESSKFKKATEKFAFSLQLKGVNSLNNTEMQELFDSDERLLLQNNSLVVHFGENWSFENALFQEHIAASLLSKMTFEKIISLCTVGKSIRKIRTKWIQTISSLLSILDNNSDLYHEIFKLIEEDNIELLFQTESSKYESDFKLSLLRKLIQKSILLNIRTFVVYEESIGLFIQSSSSCTDYLLECLENKDLTERIKVFCAKILKSTSLNTNQQKRYWEFIKNELQQTKDFYYASTLIQVLTANKFGDEKIIEELCSIEHLNEMHEFRDHMYELINVLNLVDRFYLYGIGGLPYLAKHNKDISHGGSEHNLEDFILSVQNKNNLFLLFKTFKKEGWIEYCERQGRYGRDFLQTLLDKVADWYTDIPYIIFPIASFIKDLGKKYLRQEFKQVDVFLEKTNSYWLMVRILVDDIFNDTDWELGSLITHESYDYLLYEFEEREYEPQKLRNCFSGLRYKHKTEIADTFYQLCIAVTEEKIINKAERSLQQMYNEAEIKKRENDLLYIQSKEAFKEGIVKYFQAYGKKSIPQEELYVDMGDTNFGQIRQQADSYFIYKYLTRWLRNLNHVNLAQCLRRLEKDDFFNTFRIEEILNYSYKDEIAEKAFFSIVEEYYHANLPIANFKNCMWIDENGYHSREKENLLGEIFKKYRFQTEDKYLIDFIWLDNGGTRTFQAAAINNSKSISEMVLEQLSELGKLHLKNQIVENIISGIKLESVLGTHIGLCKHLKITEAKDIILNCIKKATENHLINKTDAIDIYLELGGSQHEILDIYKNLEDYNSYVFFYLTTKLYKVFSEEVSSIGLKALFAEDTHPERKVQVAQVLSEINVFDAFLYLVNQIKINNKSPHHIRSGHPITNFNTQKALKELKEVIYLVVDPKYNDERLFRDSAKSIILEWCYSLASKGETDLELVIEFFENARDELLEKQSNAKDLNWYINRALENFRNSEETVKSLPEIKKLIFEVDYLG